MYYWVRTSTVGHRTLVRTSPELSRRHVGPSGGPQVPPSKVRALARSRDGEDLGACKGPVLTRVQALPYAPRLGQRPAAAA
jgi:hypothetical protein